MLGFASSAGARLEWRQPEAFRRFHEFTVDGVGQGRLHFEKGCGTLAAAEYGNSRWTFKRSGFWSPKVTVREAGSETDMAVFTPRRSGGGELRLATGGKFQLKSAGLWSGEWAFETEGGAEVVSVHGPHGLIRNRGEVCLGLGAASRPETPLLLMLLWYLLLLMQDDAAAATSAAVACG